MGPVGHGGEGGRDKTRRLQTRNTELAQIGQVTNEAGVHGGLDPARMPMATGGRARVEQQKQVQVQAIGHRGRLIRT